MSLYFPTDGDYATRTIFPGVVIHTCSVEKMMLSVVDLAPHSVVEEHSHPHEQVGMLLEGRVRFFIGGEEKLLKKGDTWRIPGNVKHKVVVLDEPAKALDIFCPPRDDYR
jgi:quercetin dioxygenase-like cupin family protein